MKTFLEIVAQDIIQKHGTNLSKVAIVFPNKRASNHYGVLPISPSVTCFASIAA